MTLGSVNRSSAGRVLEWLVLDFPGIAMQGGCTERAVCAVELMDDRIAQFDISLESAVAGGTDAQDTIRSSLWWSGITKRLQNEVEKKL